MNPQTAQALVDSTLVPGIYEHCDQWCSYCPMTARCLAHRRWQALEAERGGEPFDSVEELVEFSREVSAAEGRSTPELDALSSPDPAVRARVPDVDDPLKDLAEDYAFAAFRFLHGRHWMPPVQPGPQPAPMDVVAWYHVLIQMRIGRALGAVIQAERGRPDRMMDANGCVKMVLVGIDRSRAALKRLRGDRDDARVTALLATLDRLAAATEQRFPSARSYIRPGLDGPLA